MKTNIQELLNEAPDLSKKSTRDKINRDAMLSMIKQLEKSPNRNPFEALSFAARVGEKEEFIRLYEKLVPGLDWIDGFGNDLLGYAVTGEEIAIVEFLVTKGHSINHLGRYQMTPLICACHHVPKSKKKMQSIILYLLTVGANPLLIDDFGHDALFYAKQQDYKEPLLSKLTKAAQ